MGLDVNNLVAYWGFDCNLYDSINKQHARPKNIDWDIGKLKDAAYFNGSSSYMEYFNTDYIYLDQNFTYSFWIKAPEENKESVYFNINDTDGLAMKRASDGTLSVTVSGC